MLRARLTFLDGDANLARRDPRGQHHRIERDEVLHPHLLVELHLHTQQLQLPVEVAQGLEEFLFTRYHLGEVELPADLVALLEHGDMVTALGCIGGEGEACGTCSHHSDVAHLKNRRTE